MPEPKLWTLLSILCAGGVNELAEAVNQLVISSILCAGGVNVFTGVPTRNSRRLSYVRVELIDGPH